MSFLNVSEWVVRERLSPDRSAIYLVDAREVISGERAVLRVGGTERVRDVEAAKAAVGVPAEGSDDCLGTNIELETGALENVPSVPRFPGRPECGTLRRPIAVIVSSRRKLLVFEHDFV